MRRDLVVERTEKWTEKGHKGGGVQRKRLRPRDPLRRPSLHWRDRSVEGLWGLSYHGSGHLCTPPGEGRSGAWSVRGTYSEWVRVR